jgi:hypothetical protein
MMISKNPKGTKGSGGVSGIVITKNLYPVQRGSGTNQISCPPVGSPIPIPANPDCFNPYALQLGDIIEVAISVSGTNGANFTLNDNLLTLQNDPMTHYCKPVTTPGTYSVPAPTNGWTNNVLTWINPGTTDFYYRCNVQ